MDGEASSCQYCIADERASNILSSILAMQLLTLDVRSNFWQSDKINWKVPSPIVEVCAWTVTT